MGLDLGLEEAGFEIVFAADSYRPAIATIRANKPNIAAFGHDVHTLEADHIKSLTGLDEFDLISGGPPCQSFSTAGKRLSTDDTQNGSLVFDFIRLVGDLRPRSFVMENVKGILSAPIQWRSLPYNNNGKRIDEHYGSLLRDLLARFLETGYQTRVFCLNAADFGVPQSRERVFIVGHRDGSDPGPPVQTHARVSDLIHKPWLTIRDAWKDIDLEGDTHAKFSDRKLQYLRLVPPGSNWRSLPLDLQKESMGKAFYAKGGRTGYWRRLSLDETSPTVLTEPQNASTSLCHPVEDRPISVREAARLQTFPDYWRFVGSRSEQYKLIGNAVPPRLALAVGKTIYNHLTRSATTKAA